MANVYPVAAGYPSYSGVLAPTIWSPRLLVKFYKRTVFGEIANTDFDGEIKAYGDKVTIRTTPNITISNYVVGQKLTYETPAPSTTTLNIDKGKHWGFRDDVVQEAQADYNYASDWTEDASMQLKIAIDAQILSTVYSSAHASNAGLTAGAISSGYNLGVSGTPLAVSKDNIIDVIQDCSSVLSEQNVPNESDRWMVVPEWFANRVSKSDLKDASLSGDSVSIARNGRIGMIGNFTIYHSNQLTNTSSGGQTATEIIFGHKSAITFASQLLENDGPFSHPDYFGRFYRGLQVYGFEEIKPEALGHLHAYAA